MLIEFSASATVDGRPLTWQGADRFTLDGERCISGRSYFDTAPLLAAVASAAA